MRQFVTSTMKPEWGFGLVLLEQGDRAEVFFGKEDSLKKLLRSTLVPAFPTVAVQVELIPPAATSTSPTCGRVKVLHPVGDGTVGS